MAGPVSRAQPSLACAEILWERFWPARGNDIADNRYCDSMYCYAKFGLLDASRSCFKAQMPALTGRLRMTLVSIPANPVPDDVVVRRDQDAATASTLRFARLAPPAGRKGTVCVLHGRGEYIEKYFETVRDLRDARLCRGDFRLARAGAVVSGARRPAQGPCAQFLRLRQSTSRLSCSRWCCRIARRRSSRSPIRWAAR